MNVDDEKHLWKNKFDCQVKWDVGIQSGLAVQILEDKPGDGILILATLFLSIFF